MFALLGDANVQCVAAFAKMPGVRVIHARHEHGACTMADGYARATGRVGIASVTCGPGVTQIVTALTVAARGRQPVLVFAGDVPTTASWHLHQFEQGPLAAITGAHFVPVRSVDHMLDRVREAFYVARTELRPVLLSVPLDLQQMRFPWPPDYMPAAACFPRPQRMPPDPNLVDELVDMIAHAKHPIIVAGRGVLRSAAGAEWEMLAEKCGALLGTSLFAMGLFEGNPFAIGVAGSFSGHLAREQYAACDLLIGVGAGLGHYTTEAGFLFPDARVVQIDANPHGLYQGLRVADLHIRADAKAAAEAVLNRLRERGITGSGFRTPALAACIAAEARMAPDSKPFPVAPDSVDQRAVMAELDRVIPKDWDIVVGVGQYSSIALSHLRGRRPERYHVMNDFGAIGSGLSAAIGIAVARNDGKVLLIEGDGGLLMHVQELDTVRQHGVRLLACVMNDGAYGAELHKLRAHGMDASEAIHGRADLAAVAGAFGLRSAMVNTLGRIEPLFRDHWRSDKAELWDVCIDGAIPSAAYRRVLFAET